MTEALLGRKRALLSTLTCLTPSPDSMMGPLNLATALGPFCSDLTHEWISLSPLCFYATGHSLYFQPAYTCDLWGYGDGSSG